MPYDLAKLFGPFAERLDEFASCHNLEVEKYRHDMPHWSLFFKHPLGGHGRVDIQINEKEEVFLLKWWIFDDYGLLKRRSIKSTPSQRMDNPVECLEEKLLEAIRDILGWEKKELKSQGIFSLAGFDPALQRQYPTVKM